MMGIELEIEQMMMAYLSEDNNNDDASKAGCPDRNNIHQILLEEELLNSGD